MTSTVRFRKVGQLLVDFQLIPTPSLDFQVAQNLDETAPLMFAKRRDVLLKAVSPGIKTTFKDDFLKCRGNYDSYKE